MNTFRQILSGLSLGLMGISLPSIGCKEAVQTTPHPPLNILLDTDMGSDCDDVGALALLHSYADRGKVNIIGCIYSSGKVPFGAGIIDAINRYYGRPDIPIGASYDLEFGDPADKMSAEKLARDTAAFGNRIIHNRDAAEQTWLNRSLLARQEDQSVVYITIGHTRGLYELLISEADEHSPLNGADLIRRKVSRWVALGALDANNEDQSYRKDWNFFFNETASATQYLAEHFPAPIHFVSGGGKTLTGSSLIHTPPGNIIRTAYRDWLWNVEKKTLMDQRPSWDLVTICYAVEGLGSFFNQEEEGWLEFDVEKGCRWMRGANAFQQVFIYQKDGVEADFAAYLNDRIAKLPVTD